MKKLTLLFALLCASVMSWADTELVDFSQMTLESWGGNGNPVMTKDPVNEIITVELVGTPGWQWGNQAKIILENVATNGLDVNKEYKLSFTATASTNDCGGVTLKYFDGNVLSFSGTNCGEEARVNSTGCLALNQTPLNYESEWIQPNAAETNGIIVFDFGWDAAQTITISNLSFKEREAAPAGPVSYCDYEAEHLASHSADSRVLISLEPTANTNEYKMTVKTNSTKKLDYLYVTSTGNSPYPATSGTDDNGDEFDEMSVTFTNSSTTASFYIAWSNPNWGGRWDYNLNDVTMVDLVACGSSSSDEEKPSMADASVSVDSKTHNSVVLAISGATDNVGVTQYVVKNHSDNSAVGEYAPAESKITISGLSPETAYDWDVYAKDAAGNVSENSKNITFTTEALAANYCGTTLVDGIATVDMSCEFKNNKYIITFTNPTLNSEASTLAGFNGSFCTIGGAGAHDVHDYYSVNNSERIVLEFDGVPNFYTPMYINIPANNQRTFSWPNDVVWGSCPAVAVTGVTLNHSELEMQVGGATQALTATIAPANATNQNVTWESDDTDVATVENGVVTAVGDGTAIITVTTQDGSFTASCEVTVTVPSITAATYNGYGSAKGVYALYAITRNVDQSVTFSAKVEAAFGFDKRIHYYKVGGGTDAWADLAYNSVTGTYDYTAAAGPFVDGEEWVAEFYFPFTGDAASIVCNYTVGSEQAAPASIPVGAVVLNKESNTLSVGETDNLTATVYPSFASAAGTITWASDAPAYATVDNGTVTAVAAGTANITATCGGVTSAPYVVTVTASLTEAKFYGCGAFVNNAGKAIAYDYVFTRATDHTVTLDVVFSRSMTGIIGIDNFQMYINGANQHMIYTDGTRTATYNFGAQTESASIKYYFYFVLDGGGLHQTSEATYTVGSSNTAVHAFALGEKNDDNVALIAAADGQTFDKAFVARTFPNTDEWYTLCLPFDLSDAQLTEVFGAGYTIAEMVGAEDHGSLVHLNFDYAPAFTAGKAYLLRPGTGVNAYPTFKGVTIQNVDPETLKSHNDYMDFQGTFAQITLNQENQRFVGPENYLYAPDTESGTNMKAFRCYFTIPGGSSAGAPGKRAMIVIGRQSPTGVDQISEQVAPAKFMMNGTLYIIRDGNTYNAQGMLVK